MVILYSFAIGRPMSLIFNAFEIAAMALSVLATSLVVADGESNWVEGLQLHLGLRDHRARVLFRSLTRARQFGACPLHGA